MTRSDRLVDLWMCLVRGAEVVIVNNFRPAPYGGGNQFLCALRKGILLQGVSVGVNRSGWRTRSVLFNSYNCEFDWIRALRKRGIRMIHRVDGPISAYRGKDRDVDERIWNVNRDVADVTVFQSKYSYDKHIEMGLSFVNPVIIPNACDPSIFYPASVKKCSISNRRLRLITTCWSDNTMKGGDVYRWLDQNLDFSRYEYTFVGRTNEVFKNIKVVSPVASMPLAEILRSHDIFVMASRNDCCSNSLIEALACGLPVVYHSSGGNGELAGRSGLGFMSAEEIPVLLEKIASGYPGFVEAIHIASLKEVTDRYLEKMMPDERLQGNRIKGHNLEP